MMSKFIEHLEEERKVLLKQYYACGIEEIENGLWCALKFQLDKIDAEIRYEKRNQND